MFSLRYTIQVAWEQDGRVATAELGTLEVGACPSAAEVGLKRADGKPLLTRLQEIVVPEQWHHYCQQARPCPSCQAPRALKDDQERCLDTVLGRVPVETPASLRGLPVL